MIASLSYKVAAIPLVWSQIKIYHTQPHYLTATRELRQMHYIPSTQCLVCLSGICGLCNLILCVFTELPVERVLPEQIGCSNSQSVTFPHPGC